MALSQLELWRMGLAPQPTSTGSGWNWANLKKNKYPWQSETQGNEPGLIQYGLQTALPTVNKKLQENVIQPMASTALASQYRQDRSVKEGLKQAFLASVPGAGILANQPGSQRQAEYQAWKPTAIKIGWNSPLLPREIDIKGVTQGILEAGTTLPISAAGTATGLASMASKGSKVAGKLLPIANKLAMVENLPGNVIGAGLKGIGKVADDAFKGLKIAEEAKSSVTKLTELIKEAKPLRVETGALYSVERSQRAGKLASVLEKNTGEEAFLKAKGVLKGELPKARTTTAFENVREKIETPDIEALFNTIKDIDAQPYTKLNTATALQKLLLGQIPQEAELVLLEKAFGTGLVKAVLGKRSFSTRFFEQLMDIANAPRALLSSGDVSGLLRQGGVLSARHPVEAAKTVKPMLQAMFSDKGADIVEAGIRARKFYQKGVDYGLYTAPQVTKNALTSQVLAHGEEAFMSNFMNKIPFVKASNRGYVAGLNELRSRVWNNALEVWEKAGLKPSVQDYTEMAKLINAATGRGQLGVLSKAAPLANAMLFSPRLIASRLQLPTLLMSPSKLVRAEAWKTMGAFLGVGGSILGAVSLLPDVTVEKDPRSADFGKIKVGNTRLDIWTGYVQYLRLLAQIATGERKTSIGTIEPLTRGDILSRFGRSKLSPAAGLFVDIMTEKTYAGEDMSLEGGFLKDQIFQRMAPLAMQEMYETIKQEGAIGSVLAAPGFLGVGTLTYPEPTPQEKHDMLQTYSYRTIEDQTWQGYPPELKKLSEGIIKLEKTDPSKAKQMLYQNPSVMWARRAIALEKKRWSVRNKV
jgi:hypothetical protein